MVTTRSITYQAEGRAMVGLLTRPEGTGQRPGVLISHEGPGLDDFGRSRATRLAELGYVAFALDYHGEGQPVADWDAMSACLAELSADPLRTPRAGRPPLLASHAEPVRRGLRLTGPGAGGWTGPKWA
jgi:dienelactone hydrolase